MPTTIANNGGSERERKERARKVGIVAVARKLLIALWRYVEQGEVPAGARLTDWRAKVNAKSTSAVKNTAA